MVPKSDGRTDEMRPPKERKEVCGSESSVAQSLGQSKPKRRPLKEGVTIGIGNQKVSDADSPANELRVGLAARGKGKDRVRQTQEVKGSRRVQPYAFSTHTLLVAKAESTPRKTLGLRSEKNLIGQQTTQQRGGAWGLGPHTSPEFKPESEWEPSSALATQHSKSESNPTTVLVQVGYRSADRTQIVETCTFAGSELGSFKCFARIPPHFFVVGRVVAIGCPMRLGLCVGGRLTLRANCGVKRLTRKLLSAEPLAAGEKGRNLKAGTNGVVLPSWPVGEMRVIRRLLAVTSASVGRHKKKENKGAKR
ncbi:hypothetical protein C8F04DRAFT_1366456 [Mycena alexandri]|uniref:Uncharacterized protein n=1 Tax=Mycena alexandri TaxID=1745969 RepID=A0AAD6TDY2_9AGAR|nr:hypothetical protein C8F04DRAFT_1366456 [Mycena alexandri]